MTVLIATLLTATAAVTSSSPAEEQGQEDVCGWFTNESLPYGEVIAQVRGERVLEIRDQYTGTTVYDLISAGTGMRFQEAVPRDDRESDDRPSVRMHKGDLMIGPVAYLPMCGKGGRVTW